MRILTAFPIVWLLGHGPAVMGQQHRGEIQISEERGLSDWEVDGSGNWIVRGENLVLERAGVPDGPIRRPAALAIYRGPSMTNFVLQVDVRSTAPVDLDVRDVLLIFAYQSPTQFYYVHLAAKTDPVHNGIFVVNNADRRRLDDATASPRLTDQDWHRVRLERETAAGTINVFVGDDSLPLLSATDRTFDQGRVGVGSFDETAEFRAFELRDLTEQ